MNCDNDRLVKSCKVNVMIDNPELNYTSLTSQKIRKIINWDTDCNNKIFENCIITILNYPSDFRDSLLVMLIIDKKNPLLIHLYRVFFIILIMSINSNQ